MIGWFRKLWNTTTKSYRISEVQGKWIAEANDGMMWWCLRKDGSSGVSREYAVEPYVSAKYLCDSKEEAGQRCNRHAALHDAKEVWTA
jgi:hypothetical protein